MLFVQMAVSSDLSLPRGYLLDIVSPLARDLARALPTLDAGVHRQQPVEAK